MNNQISLQERSNRVQRATWIFGLFLATDLVLLWLMATQGPQLVTMLKGTLVDSSSLHTMVVTAAMLALVAALAVTAFCYSLIRVKKNELEAAKRGERIPPSPKLLQFLQTRKVRMANVVLSLVYLVVLLVNSSFHGLDFSACLLFSIFLASVISEIRALRRSAEAKA